jgi:hypothetical protein
VIRVARSCPQGRGRGERATGGINADAGSRYVSSIIRLGKREEPRRYVIISAKNLDDDILLRAQTRAFSYEFAHECDVSAITITMYYNGRTAYESGRLGSSSDVTHYRGGVERRDQVAGRIRPALDAAARRSIPGIGTARLILNW